MKILLGFVEFQLTCCIDDPGVSPSIRKARRLPSTSNDSMNDLHLFHCEFSFSPKLRNSDLCLERFLCSSLLFRCASFLAFLRSLLASRALVLSSFVLWRSSVEKSSQNSKCSSANASVSSSEKLSNSPNSSNSCQLSKNVFPFLKSCQYWPKLFFFLWWKIFFH